MGKPASQLSGKFSHPRRKRHHEAMAKPEIRAEVASLKATWDSLNLAERGMRLQELIWAGCSTRGLENELGISDTTIRRNLRIAELPLDAAIIMQQTGSAKKALNQHRQALLRRRAEELRRQRENSEERTGKISDFVADAAFQFSRQNNVSAANLEKMVPWIRLNANLIPKDSWPKVSLKRKFKLDELFQILRPPEGPDELWMEHRAQWLARIIRALAPEDNIRRRAFEKIERGAQKALAPPELTLEEVMKAREERLKYVSQPRPRRKY